jgi:AraC-like DNA-binding protein
VRAQGRFQRVGVSVHLPAVMTEFGLDADLMIRSAGLERSLFENPDNRVEFRKLTQLLDMAAKASRCEHLGLMVGERGGLDTLGVVGAVTAECNTLGEALARIIHNFRDHDTGAVVDVDLGDFAVGVRYLVVDPDVSSSAQMVLGAMAVGRRILQQLTERRLNLMRLKLPMRRPNNPEPITKFFQCQIDYDSPVAGLFFDRAWLSRSLPAAMGAAEIGHPGSLRLSPETSEDDVERSAEIIASAVLLRVFAGASSGAQSVAEEFGFHRRTLHRRLSETGSSYQELRESLLCGMAQRFLNDTDISITKIALLLGYSELSAFTRAFRGWKAVAPSEYRKRHTNRELFHRPEDPSIGVDLL